MKKEEKSGVGRILPTVRSRIIAAVIAVVVIVAAVAIPIVCIRMDEQSREYSGEETNPALMLCLDVELMEEFKVIETHNSADGLYSEYIVAEGCVDIHIWRDFTRPKMSCKKQIKEKFPKMSGYSSQKTEEESILSERGTFSVRDEGELYRHTVVLLRKDGWDYLADFAVKDKDFEKYRDYIDNLINSFFYL